MLNYSISYMDNVLHKQTAYAKVQSSSWAPLKYILIIGRGQMKRSPYGEVKKEKEKISAPLDYLALKFSGFLSIYLALDLIASKLNGFLTVDFFGIQSEYE
eukprot:TRINITY_DN9317_c1_g1_i2.p1 TRINITY_DN9317_c1_g1~~TRINITY_DN9317_c1_g1_i2.p1  ORF type:complete len:101 (-),score=6.66 TRINITY_DN9317_c1_g1_i2:403-705(-)